MLEHFWATEYVRRRRVEGEKEGGGWHWALGWCMLHVQRTQASDVPVSSTCVNQIPIPTDIFPTADATNSPRYMYTK